MTRQLVLASGSPARRRLLLDAGIQCVVAASGVDETVDPCLGPAEATVELALRKANAIVPNMANPDDPPLVLGCDSMLFFDGAMHGKPHTAENARAAWRTRRGRAGTLWTGHALVDTSTDRAVTAACETTVHFGEVTDEEINAYVATGEPLEVAGAFTLDGRGAPFIDRIEGDHSNVVGLSLPTLRRLLRQLDLSMMDLWE